ncbi:phosphatidylserine/phosphatidylglycerophosphate/cardiolipin synthase family protein [Pistricoccus aurantiacus]|uniref:Phosphatidylserine/phosphatidylglycerophosphate/ cardiolipin synthase family protein n=1 Tax=Pistricoccus aurantiacus TaxID=1883414 RepID=A0A5B8SWA1_9GAMM|nr:phospholipase D-like domain-containing protein [Pistricoccus aurantiacus]QEA39030.1 phosphatidylserine/phosphatidylglycerophosphate/cardiolipin synthase family protein [Pistricoccus aurantiacus]
MQGCWREGNRFVLLPEGSCFLPTMFEALSQARRWILVELYLMESGVLATRLIDALIEAANRGVTVLLMLDGFGSWKLSSGDRRRLSESGIALRFFNPLALKSLTRNLTRDHRKLVIVDGRVAFTGGFGAVDAFMDAWFEVAVRIEGPVINDWFKLFADLWDSQLTQGSGKATLVHELASEPVEACYGNAMRGRVMWGKGYRYQAIRRSLQRRVVKARQRIWLCTPYFVPTLSLRLRLAKAASRGVDVRLLLPGSINDNPGVRYAGHRFYQRLLKSGVRIHEFQPTFIHAKFSLVDDWCSIGSCNFDHWSLQWNLEANQEIQDSGFANRVRELFERNFAASREIELTDWLRRSWHQRLREWLFGTLNAWLTRLK